MYYYTKIISNVFIDTEINRTRHNFRDLATKQDLWQVFVIILLPQQQHCFFLVFLVFILIALRMMISALLLFCGNQLMWNILSY